MITAALAAGLACTLTATSPASAAVTVQATPNAASVEMGQRVAVTGAISPGKAGVQVVAEVKAGSGWRAVKSGKTGPGGSFTLSVLPTDPGSYEYRVSAKSRGKTTGASAPFVITSLMWHYLADVRMAADSCGGGCWPSGSARINGKTFPHSMWESRDFFAEYDLGRSCTRFRATAGMSDNSRVSSANYQFSVLADGASLFAQSLGLGQSGDIDLDLSDHLRLRLELVPNVAWGDAVFGDARILCAFGRD